MNIFRYGPVRLQRDFGSLFGGKSGNQVADIALPKNVTDPLYTSSQAQLDKLGTNLLSGTPLPGMYSDLGVANSPAFQEMLNGVKGQTMQSAQEVAAINGTGRSGTAITASNQALNGIIPQLTYQDFLNSQNQQYNLLGLGTSVESGVRSSAQNQQQFDTNFNQNLFNDQFQQASYNNTFNANAAKEKGQAIGSLIQGGIDVAAAPFTGGLSLAGIPGLMGGGGVGGTGTPSTGQNLSSIISALGSFGKGTGNGGYDIAAGMGEMP